MKNNLKQATIKLRKQGHSYGEISKQMNVAKSTLSFWLKDIQLSKVAKNRLEKNIATRNTMLLKQYSLARSEDAKTRADKIKLEAMKMIRPLKKNELFFLGLGLYWGEGYKVFDNHRAWQAIDFVNSDPTSVVCFMEFLKVCCNILPEECKLQIHLHSDNDAEMIIDYWAALLSIPRQNIMKPIFTYKQNRISKRILSYGTVHLRVYNRKHFQKLMGWLSGLQNLYQQPH
jgi:hypothetical protein